MAQRRFLLIGSQCNSLNRLSFLPDVAKRLHTLMVNPGPGECLGIHVENGLPGLLLDPTVEAAKKAIKTAIKDAAEANDSLILAFIGHGDFQGEASGDFYLRLTDSTESNSDEAIHIAQFVMERLHPNLDGLVALLDTCHAGAGTWQAMERWAQSVKGNIKFEILTATDDRATANAPLARDVIELMERGDPEVEARIHCRDVHYRLKERNQASQHVAYNANVDLGRNIARDPGDVFWKDSPGRAQILKQTEYFQPTPQLDELVEASRLHPVVVLTGEAGAGKSTLAAALARPELTHGHVPDGFAQAVAVLNQTTNQRSLADDLERQLRRSIPAFTEAVAEFERSVPLPKRERLDFLRKKVLGPLAYLAGPLEVRVVLDGFDQLTDTTRSAVGEALGTRLSRMRLVITARDGTPDCSPGHTLHHGRTSREALDCYLISRRIPEAARGAILDKARDHWLVARLLADAVLADPKIDLAFLPGTVNDAFTKLLDQARAADSWNARFRPVLGPLAVAGPGPVLPLPLLAYASGALGGLKDAEAVRSVLADMRGLVMRRHESTPAEHVGLFHPTLADYLLGPSSSSAGYALDVQAAHRAIAQAIEAMAPSSQHKPDNPLHRYAFLREADHLWAIGDVDGVFGCLTHRESNDPRENLERWHRWLPRFRERFGEVSPRVLVLRGWLAFCAGTAGDAREAFRLTSELLPERERVLGPSHPDTLRTRINVAFWTGEMGDTREALRLASELLPDLRRVLGPGHPDTLRTRSNIAFLTGAVGDAREALRLASELLPDLERVLGPEHLPL